MAKTVSKVDAVLQDLGLSYTLLVAEDGSTDGTFQVAQDLTSEYPNLQVVHHDAKLGRGRALRTAWLCSKADVYVFMDADLATDLAFLPRLAVLMVSGGLDFVTGSRYSPGSRVQRPLLRKTVSLAYNEMVKRVFRTGVSDHQCGFKAFSRRAVREILPLTRENGWAWDTEVIVYVSKLRLRMAELPVDWQEMKGTRTPIRRLLNDMWDHGMAFPRIFARSRSLQLS